MPVPLVIFSFLSPSSGTTACFRTASLLSHPSSDTMAMPTAVAAVGATTGIVPAARPFLAAGSSPSRQLGFSLSGALSGLSLSVPAATACPAPAVPVVPSVYCGRGDRKTARGKRFSHSFGNARPRNKNKGSGPPRSAVPPAPPRKDRFDDGEIVKIEIDESLFSQD